MPGATSLPPQSHFPSPSPPRPHPSPTSTRAASIRQTRLEKKDRINVFYSLQEFATSPRTADLPFLVFEGKTWSFRETYDTVLRYAGWLHRSHGVKSRDIVALDFPNCPQFVFLWLALWSLGAVAAFINHTLTGSPLVHSIRVSTARLLIVDPEVRSMFTPDVEAELTSPTSLSSTTTSSDEPSDPLTMIYFNSTIQSTLPYQPAHLDPTASRSATLPRHPAILIYTSGTTGLPKPAISSWTKLHTGGRFVASWMGLRPATHPSPDRFYCCMPLYHSSGSVLGFANCLMNGTTFVLGRRFSTSGFWREVRESEATVMQYVGETCRYLSSAPAEPDPSDPTKTLDTQHKIRIAFGNGLRADVWDRFKTRFGIETIAEFYAATEGTSGAWNYSSNSFSSGAVGRNGVIAGWLLASQVAVVQVDYESEMPVRDAVTGLCVRAPRGEEGELLYALDAADITEKFQGYLGNKAASRKKVARDVVRKGDAWFRTGDVLTWDAEGRWWFVDRVGDTFRWKGENVSTAEVAQILGGLEPVQEANVYGVLVPGTEGRAGCAALVLRDEWSGPTRKDDPITDEEEEKAVLMADLATHLRTHLPEYAIPLFLRLVKQMQRTGNMKQQKSTVRAEGLDLDRIEGDYGEEVWWLKGPAYVRFRREDWAALAGGRVKL